MRASALALSQKQTPFWRRPIHLSALIAPPRYAAIGFGALLLQVAASQAEVALVTSEVKPQAVGAPIFALLGLGVLVAVIATGHETRWRDWTGKSYVRLGRVVATIMMAVQAALALVIIGFWVYILLTKNSATTYWNDVISFSDSNARALLAGHNPYTNESNFLLTLARFPQALPTPLQGPVFGYGAHYPSTSTLVTIDRAYQRDPARYAAAFDPRTLHSYPALSFLLYLPLVVLGLNILWLHLALYFVLLGSLIRLASPHERGWVAFTALAALSVVAESITFDTEIVCLAFLLVAWHWRDQRWVSAIALGLGCAFKQYCWLFAPFLLVDVWRREGWREAWRRGMIAGGAFLLPNLPFIVASPHAWFTSMLLPATDPLFPQGLGLVALSLGHLVPLWPRMLFTAFEIMAFAALLWAYGRWRRYLQGAALLLPLAAILVGYRSPSNYFAVAPWIALFCLLTIQRVGVDAAMAAGEARAVLTPSLRSVASGLEDRA